MIIPGGLLSQARSGPRSVPPKQTSMPSAVLTGTLVMREEPLMLITGGGGSPVGTTSSPGN